jgi:hypothetical protein
MLEPEASSDAASIIEATWDATGVQSIMKAV